MSQAAPRIACVVLAAGLSTRMAPRNKLLVRDPDGVAMVARVAQACSASRAERLVVVTGHQSALVEDAVRRAGVEAVFVHATDYASGMSASLRAGVAALPGGVDGALICLGDMPLVDATLIDRLIAAFAPQDGRGVVVPCWAGRRGNPVLWDRRFFAEIGALSGDAGARSLITRHCGCVAEVAAGPGALVDFDTEAALLAGGPGASPSS